MRQPDPLHRGGEQGKGGGSTHTPLPHPFVRLLIDALVRQLQRLFQQWLDLIGATQRVQMLAYVARRIGNSDAASDLASLRPTHPVGDETEPTLTSAQPFGQVE